MPSYRLIKFQQDQCSFVPQVFKGRLSFENSYQVVFCMDLEQHCIWGIVVV